MRRALTILALLAAAGCVDHSVDADVQEPPPCMAAATPSLHCTVGASESWAQIATARGVTVAALKAANYPSGALPSDSSHPRTGSILHVPPTTTSPTTTTSTSTTTPATSAPSTTATPTTASPTTTVPPATTTTVAPTTVAPTSTTASSSSSSTSTSTTQPAPSTTQPPGVAFSEDFSQPTAFSQRFDHGFSGGWDRDETSGWHADHDAACADPNSTFRVIDQQYGAHSNQFYPCLPGGDPAKGHVMTTVNTHGYAIAWFSPKPVFTDVTKVCWDQNLTFLGQRKWTQVEFLTPGEYQGQSDLGMTSPEFPNNGGPSTPRGSAAHGVKIIVRRVSGAGATGTSAVNVRAWPNDFGATGIEMGPGTNDKAGRYRFCATDNTITATLPNGQTVTKPMQIDIPAGPIRVVFQDDNYNPDKYFEDDEHTPVGSSQTGLYTWHWDNISVETS